MAQTKERPSIASYKRLLLEAKELRGESGIKAHRRATILVKLFDDADFRSEIGAVDDFAVEGFLNELVEDLALGFLELRSMLGEFPLESEWSDGKLATLYSKAVENIDCRRKAEEKPARAVHRVTREQYDALKDEKQEVEARLRFSDSQFKAANDRLSDLERENRELRLENERLKGRIEQLERGQRTAA